MKKATTKRERKYGKKVEDYKDSKTDEQPVKLMVDGYNVIQFKNKKLANAYIERKHKESLSKRRRPASFIFL